MAEDYGNENSEADVSAANAAKNGRKHRIAALLFGAVVISFLISIIYFAKTTEKKLNIFSERASEQFSSLMEQYRRSFLLYEQLLQKVTADTPDPDGINKYLKTKDKILSKIDENYDGVYMYYRGRYIYSWDTPYSVYGKSGYDATARPWYTGAVKAGGKVHFSEPYPSYANDYILATISRLQPDGQTVIAYDIKLGAIQNFADRLNILKGTLSLSCSGRNIIIGSSEPLYLGRDLNMSRSELEKLDETKNGKKTLHGAKNTEKAQWEAASAAAFRKFGLRHCEFISRLRKNKNQLLFSTDCTCLGYAFGSGGYTHYIVIPIAAYVPEMLRIWSFFFLVILAAGLVYGYISVRFRSAKDMKLKNEQLSAAADKARRANSAKSQFLAQISHEIRTPMNAIIGLTELAKNNIADTHKAAEYLNKIDGSSRLLLSIINDVLDMSAISSGKLKLEKSPYDFKDALTTLTNMFYQQAKQKDIDLKIHIRGLTEETLVGDELRVNQILMNLLSNSIKFTPSGGKIDLSVVQTDDSEDRVWIRFIVADTGCGMSRETQCRIFEPFEQGPVSTARRHGGSGLGLSIVKKLVEKMGGSISVQSELNCGATFTVDIPFGKCEQKRFDSAHEFAHLRALIVDDDKDSRDYSAAIMERLGLRYGCAASGKEAIETLSTAKESGDEYRLCLIDWKMPVMDGIELTKKIRAELGRDTIIIIVSAYDINELKETDDAAGVDYFISKPVFQSAIYDALMNITGKAGPSTRAHNISYDFSGRKVLLAEDVALNMEVAVSLLESTGAEMICAEDGREAVQIYEKQPSGTFSCILLDINMPVMDGYEAARAIRKSTKADAATIPIFAMTANAFSSDIAAAKEAGMDGHIAKPIDTKTMYAILDRAFKNGRKS